MVISEKMECAEGSRTAGCKMFGVVLWSSKDDHKAVIWCEDHGDLAFYNGGGNSVFDGDGLDAGDLIRFNLSEGRDMRVATDPQLIAEQHYPGLAENLALSGAQAASQVKQVQSGDTGNVVPFAPRPDATRKAS